MFFILLRNASLVALMFVAIGGPVLAERQSFYDTFAKVCLRENYEASPIPFVSGVAFGASHNGEGVHSALYFPYSGTDGPNWEVQVVSVEGFDIIACQFTAFWDHRAVTEGIASLPEADAMAEEISRMEALQEGVVPFLSEGPKPRRGVITITNISERSTSGVVAYFRLPVSLSQ